MTDIYQEIQALVGKDIEFQKGVEKYVDDVDAGMRATVLRVTDEMNSDDSDPCLCIHYSFTKFDQYNRPFEGSEYYDKDGKATLTAREAGMYQDEGTIYVGKDWRECLYVVDSAQGRLFDLFITDKESEVDISYVAWLEIIALDAMPHLKSDG